MLQTRNSKRTAPAALKIAVDLVNEGKLKKEEAILKVELNNLIRCFIRSSTLPR